MTLLLTALQSYAALILLVLGAFMATTVAWTFYIAAMGLIPRLRAGTIPRWVRPFAYTAVLMALVLDACVNLLFSILLLDLPREPLLTGKLKRLKAAGGRRGRFADLVCRDCLNPFDLSGDHC